MKRFFKSILIVGIGYLIFVLVAFPERCMAAAAAALRLSVNAVIPALFPFFVLSRLLIALGVPNTIGRYLAPLMRPLFGIPGSGAVAVVLGLVSGYPVGADTVKNLYRSGQCTKAEAERMLTFCNNSGPLFVIGTLGMGMLKHQQLGWMLYGVHLFSALLTGILFRKLGRAENRQPALPPATEMQSVFSAVADGVNAVLQVCGFVVLFAVVGATIPDIWGKEFLYAFLEITGGIHALLQTEILGDFLLPAVSMVLAFSGVSVLFQAAGILLPAGLSLKPYLLGKLTQGVLAFFLTGVCLRFCPKPVPVFLAEKTTPLLKLHPVGVAVVLLGLLLCIKKALTRRANPKAEECPRLPERRSLQGLPSAHRTENRSRTPQSASRQTPDESV